MNSKLKTLLGILALVVLIGAAYFVYNNLADRYKPIKKEQGIKQAQSTQKEQITQQTQSTQTQQANGRIKALDFSVLNSDGKSVKLSDFFGKPIVVNFWASWCPPCKSEMPYFNKVYAEVKSDVEFMMVDLVDGQRETVDTGKGYVDKQGYTFPVYFDTDQEAAYTYGIQSIPTTLFIDKDGYIVNVEQGSMDEETLLKNIELIK